MPDSTRFEESVQSNLNDWFEGFSDSWFDLISDKPQPEYLFELLFVIKHAGYDCFLSRLKSDNERWMALKRSFTKYPEMTAFYFSLSQLSKEKSGSGKTYFEILCRKQYGLDFLKEVWESMSIPGMLDKDPLPSLPAILFGASSDTEWGKLSEENNLLMYLLNHPTGRHIFKTLFTSQLFSSLSSKDKDGETLLHWAVRNQRINVIVLIMAARDSALREGLLRGEDDVLGVKTRQDLRRSNWHRLTIWVM